MNSPVQIPARAIGVLSDKTNQNLNHIFNHIGEEYETFDEESVTSSPFFIDFIMEAITMPSSLRLISYQWNLRKFGKPYRHLYWPMRMQVIKWDSFISRYVLFMVLTVLKRCQNWKVTAVLFVLKKNNFKRLLKICMKTWKQFWPLIQKVRTASDKKLNMSRCGLKSKLFHKFYGARYFTNSTFQQGNRPFGNVSEFKGSFF